MSPERLTDPGEQAFERALAHEQAGRLAEAEAAYREALAVHPDWLGALNNLGNVLRSLGRSAEAERCFRDALGFEAAFAEAGFNLAGLLRSQGREGEAQSCLQQLLAALGASGDALVREGRHGDAAECYRNALYLQPDNTALINNYALALEALGRSDEALEQLSRARALDPRDAEAAFNYGIVKQGQSRFEEAIEAFDEALRLAPTHGEAALSKGLSRLALGDYARGWIENEARHGPNLAKPRVTKPELPFPMWRGEPLAGRRFLLVGEQGFGDQVQFLRFAEPLARLGAIVDVAVDKRLQRLADGAAGVRNVITAVAKDPGAYDFWSLMMSVPRYLGTTIDSVPANIPYLRPSPAADVAKWAKRLEALPRDRFKVGLVWTGRDRKINRTMPFEALRPLAKLRGIAFVGMQFGEEPAQGTFPDLQLGPEVGDFADQAALIANLDLLVTVDTAAGHVAGALGYPVWTMLPANADWRWMREREDTPWYPNVRLYRQPSRNAWDAVVVRIGADLEKLLAGRGPVAMGSGRPA